LNCRRRRDAAACLHTWLALGSFIAAATALLQQLWADPTRASANPGMKLADARRIAMSLPEATEEPHFDLTSFRIKGKIFATAPPGGEYLHVFVSEEERELALVMAPDGLEKLLWGGKVRGLRVVLSKAKPKVVADLLMRAWSGKAPKRLLAKRSAANK
jgi:hypothetical protein